MRLRTLRTAPSLILTATALVLTIQGCGDDEGTAEQRDGAASAPDASAFPAVDGRTIEQLLADTEPGDELVVSPAGQVFTEGRNRFGFGVFTLDREQVTDAQVAIYTAPASGGEARGPFPARVESLETEAAFTAENTAADPDAARVVYVADLQLDQPGEWRVAAIIKRGEETVGTRIPSIVVGRFDVPEQGEKAPAVHTPTEDEVANIQEIDTRVPPGTMHEHDLAEVLGEQPVALLFATPALCQSRVCGPVVDVAEQVKRDRDDDAAFIHSEIYEENNPSKGPRPQVQAYRLPSEPWLFVIDCQGKIDTRIEGAFSVNELTAAVDRVEGSC